MKRTICIGLLPLLAWSCTGGEPGQKPVIRGMVGQAQDLLGMAESPRTQDWHWLTGLATSGTRAELLPADVPTELLLSLLRPDQGSQFEGKELPATARVTRVASYSISDCQRLHTVVERCGQAKKKPAVKAAIALGEQGTHEFDLLQEALLRLALAAAPAEPVIRLSEDGNPWLLVRHEGIACKVLARVERNRKILHVNLSVRPQTGAARKLPADVTASCSGTPLTCLTASDALSHLYDEAPTLSNRPGAGFAVVAEREDYLLPKNYSRIAEAFDRRGQAKPKTPALSSQLGVAYPGPAPLGDARALSGFLMQPQLSRRPSAITSGLSLAGVMADAFSTTAKSTRT
jgi:hypothetical protein